MRKVDMTGVRFGALVVTRETAERKHGYVVWLCTCDCGNTVVATRNALQSGRRRSCGCARRKPRGSYLPVGEAELRSVYQSRRSNARGRRIPWELSYEVYVRLVLSPCCYCGSEPAGGLWKSLLRRGVTARVPCNGLDRVASSLGYTQDNVVPCCGVCNRAKYTMTSSEFAEWAQRLSKRAFWL